MQHPSTFRPFRTRGLVGLVAGAAALTGIAVAGPASAAPRDPAGANGTITVDGAPFDTSPDNEPHVACAFQIDFAGFDEGDHVAEVDISVQPPTGRRASIVTDTVFVGEDPAGGANDLDAERTYDLARALTAYEPHPEQGHHVKVTVEAPGRAGKIATKHKVFWVEGCEAPVPCEELPEGCGNPE